MAIHLFTILRLGALYHCSSLVPAFVAIFFWVSIRVDFGYTTQPTKKGYSLNRALVRRGGAFELLVCCCGFVRCFLTLFLTILSVSLKLCFLLFYSTLKENVILTSLPFSKPFSVILSCIISSILLTISLPILKKPLLLSLKVLLYIFDGS